MIRARLYLGYALCRFYRACFKYGRCITWHWAQFKNITSSSSSTSLVIDVAMSARWQTAQAVVSVFASPFYLTSILSVPLDVRRANASTKGSQPFDDVWRIHEKAHFSVQDEGERKRKKRRKEDENARKISRAVILVRIRGGNSRWFSARLARPVRRRRGFPPRRWYSADALLSPTRSNIADNAIPRYVEDVLQRRRLRFTVAACGRLLESSIRDGYHITSRWIKIHDTNSCARTLSEIPSIRILTLLEIRGK